MKTILIVILSLALLAAAFITRPGKRDFILHLLDAQSAADGSFSRSAIEHADRLANSVTIKNRFLWTDIEKDGKILYTGAFSHWVNRSQPLDKSLPNAKDLAKILAQQ